MISILVPTLDNLEYLKLFCKSVEKNTSVPFEILIWNNENSKDINEFCEERNYRCYTSTINYGITKPYNVMVECSNYELVFLADNDYYCLPGWDSIALHIEGVYWKRPALIDRREHMRIRSEYGNYGANIEEFQEEKIIRDYRGISVRERLGTHMPPVMKKEDYINIGGFNEDFYVGETDFLYRSFCYYQKHNFEQLVSTNSFIYHFGSKTPRKYTNRNESDNSKNSKKQHMEVISVLEARRHNDFLIETYNKDEAQLGALMGIY